MTYDAQVHATLELETRKKEFYKKAADIVAEVLTTYLNDRSLREKVRCINSRFMLINCDWTAGKWSTFEMSGGGMLYRVDGNNFTIARTIHTTPKTVAEFYVGMYPTTHEIESLYNQVPLFSNEESLSKLEEQTLQNLENRLEQEIRSNIESLDRRLTTS